MILVEVDSGTNWRLKEEILPFVKFKKKKKYEAFVLYQPSYE